MNILVTGGAGFIGSHTCKALSKAGYQPVTFDNLSTGHAESVQWGPLIVGDLGDHSALRSLFRRFQFSGVIHFAASAYVGESTEHPGKYYRNNLVNSLNLLDAMVEGGVPSIVFSSTCATYGVPSRTPISEDHPQNPCNPYGETKLAVERALNWYRSAYGLNYVILRYFNAAGADPDGDIGEVHDPETHLIPIVLDAATGKKDYVRVFGYDYPTSDGSAVRDYVHVTDLADAHVKALSLLNQGSTAEAFNLGTGQGTSVLEVIEHVETAVGQRVPVKMEARREGDPPELIADSSKALRGLLWTPQYSSMETRGRTALNFQKLGWRGRKPQVVAGGR